MYVTRLAAAIPLLLAALLPGCAGSLSLGALSSQAPGALGEIEQLKTAVVTAPLAGCVATVQQAGMLLHALSNGTPAVPISSTPAPPIVTVPAPSTVSVTRTSSSSATAPHAVRPSRTRAMLATWLSEAQGSPDVPPKPTFCFARDMSIHAIGECAEPGAPAAVPSVPVDSENLPAVSAPIAAPQPVKRRFF